MKLKKLLPIFLLSIFLVSCNKEEEPDPGITNESIESAFRDIDLSPGVKDVSIQVAENEFYDFRVIIPDIDFTKNWPLILAFHGASGGNPDAHKTTECYIEPGFIGMDAFIIHPNGGQFEWYESRNQIMTQNLITLAVTMWPIDDFKIAATGYSNGGNMSWLLADHASNVFSASIPIASSYDVSLSDSTSRKIDIPMYVIHGENDELFPIERTKKWVDESIVAGSDITFVEAEGLSHNEPCSYVPYVKDAATWLQELWK